MQLLQQSCTGSSFLYRMIKLYFLPHSAIARIQFRLPDGSSLTNQFPSETTLQEARQFAAQVSQCSVFMQ